MIITVIGVLLYFSSEDRRWSEFKAPIIATLRDDNKWALRWVFLVLIPLLPGYIVYGIVNISRWPRAAHTNASAIPVLPLVGSTITVLSLMSPAR